MREASAVSDVVHAIRARLEEESSLIVAVDGLPGSGKSTLCESLRVVTPAAHLKVDEFVKRKQGQYLVHLRREELAERVSADRSASTIVLFDGVCVLAVLEAIGLTADMLVYVQRVDRRGEWFDGEPFTGGLREIEATAWEEVLAATAGGELSELTREVIHYHFAYRPWERADIVYQHADAPES